MAADVTGRKRTKALKLWRESLKAEFGRLVDVNVWEYSGDAIKFFRQPDKPAWLQEVEQQGLGRPTAGQIASLIHSVNSELAQGNYTSLDRELAAIGASSISMESLVAIVRATYHCRALLQSWKPFLRVAVEQAKVRGYNEKTLFTGLV